MDLARALCYSDRMSHSGVLFVSEKFPWPVDDGGQARSYHVLRCLAASAPVTLVSNAPPDPKDIEPIRDLGVEVVIAGKRAAAWTTPFHAGTALFSRAPYPMRKNHRRAILEEIRRRVSSGEVGVLHFNHLDAAQYVAELGPLRNSVRCIFDTHNVLTTMYERLRDAASNVVARRYLELQWVRMSRFEREVMRGMDLVCVCSDVERALLRTWGIDGALVVPNGVDTDFFQPDDGPRVAHEHPVIVFTGALGYAPNADGLRWFLDAVLPELEKLLPGFTLRLVGKDPPADLLARAVPGRIELTGRVDDVRPYMRDASVFICPLRIGGGTRLKILDAMALELPVVSTTIGAEGLAVTSQHNIVLADERKEFAHAICDLVRSPQRAEHIAANGRALVVAKYGWEGVVAPLVEHVKLACDLAARA